MMILGLTGGMATGKTTIAQIFHDMGIPVHDSDQAVHTLMNTSKTSCFSRIAQLVPSSVQSGKIDRFILSQAIQNKPSLLQKIEAIIHPQIEMGRKKFIRHHRQHKSPCIILDIPLLFEKGRQSLCDKVIVAHCPPWIQKERILQRPHMTVHKMSFILQRQWDNLKRQYHGDFIIQTAQGQAHTRHQIQCIFKELDLTGTKTIPLFLHNT